MINKKRVFRIAALLLVLCMISTVMISGTFAKYTSAYAGQDTALVARWSFVAQEGTTNLGAPGDTPLKALDLFGHAYDTNINEKDGEDFIIAPGVDGDFTINLKFLSDVNAEITVDFTEDDTDTGADGLPIEYSVVDGTWVTLDKLPSAFATKIVADNGTELENAVNNTFTFKRSDIDAADAIEISQVVKWRWAFDLDAQDGDTVTAIASDDDIDTEFGNASALGGATRTKYILNVSVKAEQLAPTKVAEEDAWE
jgi:hypothetical protein